MIIPHFCNRVSEIQENNFVVDYISFMCSDTEAIEGEWSGTSEAYSTHALGKVTSHVTLHLPSAAGWSMAWNAMAACPLIMP